MKLTQRYIYSKSKNANIQFLFTLFIWNRFISILGGKRERKKRDDVYAHIAITLCAIITNPGEEVYG